MLTAAKTILAASAGVPRVLLPKQPGGSAESKDPPLTRQSVLEQLWHLVQQGDVSPGVVGACKTLLEALPAEKQCLTDWFTEPPSASNDPPPPESSRTGDTAPQAPESSPDLEALP